MMQTTQHEEQTTVPDHPPRDPHEENPVPYKEGDIGDAMNASTEGDDESAPDSGG